MLRRWPLAWLDLGRSAWLACDFEPEWREVPLGNVSGSRAGCDGLPGADQEQGEPESESYPRWRGTGCSPALPPIRRPAVEGKKVWDDRADRGTPLGPAGTARRKRSTRTAAKTLAGGGGFCASSQQGEACMEQSVFMAVTLFIEARTFDDKEENLFLH